MAVAAEVLEIVNRHSFHDRDELLKVAEAIVAKSDIAACAELSWAILVTCARLQARAAPRNRLAWRPSQVKRRRKFSVA
jgi:hypothetical protein